MQLHEEYLKRNSLDVPLVLYNHKSRVFLRAPTETPMLGIVSVTWRAPDKHPGFFEMNFSSVIHDGYAEGRLIAEDISPQIWYWDEYECKLLWTIDQLKKRSIKAFETSEQSLGIWQMFLLMYDSWLAKNMDLTFFELVYKSLDTSLNVDERYKAFQNAQSKLAVRKAVHDVWLYQLWPLAKVNSEWLIRLIND